MKNKKQFKLDGLKSLKSSKSLKDLKALEDLNNLEKNQFVFADNEFLGRETENAVKAWQFKKIQKIQKLERFQSFRRFQSRGEFRRIQKH